MVDWVLIKKQDEKEIKQIMESNKRLSSQKFPKYREKKQIRSQFPIRDS